MGIKGLWSLLNPYCEKKSLYEIRGQTVAVDLAGWVCDSQNVVEYNIQPKLYLRNLFFRTSFLLLHEVTPIFVLEGDAPALKQDVMAARNAVQFPGAAPRNPDAPAKKPNLGRKRFGAVLKLCESMLKSMGVKCIKGKGEAEALCAHLNLQGIVDAVVSQDSDCFAYGAFRVYRNFSVVCSGGGGAQQGSVDCYDIATLRDALEFGRNKMICLALLCGCDYSVGAVGVSIKASLAFLETVKEDDALNRLLSWVSDPEVYEKLRQKLEAPGLCHQCGHIGKQHTKNGCVKCGTNKGCLDNGYKQEKQRIVRELSLRQRALSGELPFPDPLVMKEYLQVPERPPLDLKEKPATSLIQFVAIMRKNLSWAERYCVEKFLPLMTAAHLRQTVARKTIGPKCINKKRILKGIPSYEVVWEDIAGEYEGLVPDDQLKEGETLDSIWTTIERQDLMQQAYPELTDEYQQRNRKPIKQKKSRKVKETEDNTSLKKTKTRKAKLGTERSNASTKKNRSISLNINKTRDEMKKRRVQKKMDSFISKKSKKNKESDINNVVDSFDNMCVIDKSSQVRPDIYHKIPKNMSFLNNLSKDEFSDQELSVIIDQIFTNKKSLPIIRNVHRNFVHEALSSSTPIKKHAENKPLSLVETSFFDAITDNKDAFEISLEQSIYLDKSL